MANMWYHPNCGKRLVYLSLGEGENLVFGEVQKDNNGRPFVVATIKDKEGKYVNIHMSDLLNDYCL